MPRARSIAVLVFAIGAVFEMGCTQISPSGPSVVQSLTSQSDRGIAASGAVPNGSTPSELPSATRGSFAEAAAARVTNVIVPFDTVLQGPTEPIAAVGRLHVTVVERAGLVTVHSNLLGATGVGEDSGTLFVISGADVQQLSSPPSSGDIGSIIWFLIVQSSRDAQKDLKYLMEFRYYLRRTASGQLIVSVDDHPCIECTL